MPDNPDEPFNASRAEVFDALGHPTRIKILQVLSEKPLGFSEVKRGTGVESNGLLSFHLGKLTGLVKINPEGSYALTEEGKEALRMVEASKNQSQEGAMQRPSVRVPHLKPILAALVLVLIILAAASAIQYNQIQALDSRTQPGPLTTTLTDTVTSSITTTATGTVTTTVTSTGAGTPGGPPVYVADQVVPIDVASPTGPGEWGGITPDEVRLVVGVNNTVSFVNSGKTFAAVDSIIWPANATGFGSSIMSPGENYNVSLSSPGLYDISDYIYPTFVASASILVVDVPNISAATSNNTIRINSLSLCAIVCSPKQSIDASVLVAGDSPLTGLVLYLNGASEGMTAINDTLTNYTYQYSANLANSSIPIVNGDTYFVELVATFANNQIAVATASALAT